MRKIMAVLVLLVLVLGVASAEVYPMAFFVAEVNRKADTVILWDFNGGEWVWEGCDDWEESDICAGLIDDCGTNFIYDDEIINLRYCGFFQNIFFKRG